MNRKASRKALLALDGDPGDPPVPAMGRVPSGAVRAMGLSLGQLQDEAAAAQVLREQIADGATVAELDPATVDVSFVIDRVAADDKAELDDLVQSLKESGQQVPALVRPHPQSPERYQVAYGHRRLHAVKLLGLPFKAVVRPMTDAELVIAQGQENLGRRDLSFIERAQFAARLAQRGFDRPTLNAALSVHAAEMTRYLAVIRAIPLEIIRAVGSAPKAGRTRWMEMARLMNDKSILDAVCNVLGEPGFSTLATDVRFALAYDAARRAAISPMEAEVWHDPLGEAIMRIERSPATTRLTVNEKLAPGFGSFIVGQTAALFQTYLAQKRKLKGDA